MTVYLDGDSFPAQARQIVHRRCLKSGLALVYVARRALPESQTAPFPMVCPGEAADAADDWILNHLLPGDLVLTRDIPFASRVLAARAFALNDRGDEFLAENIASRIGERNFMAEMRLYGLAAMGKRTWGEREKKKFADCFDKILTRLG